MKHCISFLSCIISYNRLSGLKQHIHSQSFYGSEVHAWLNWVLRSVSLKAVQWLGCLFLSEGLTEECSSFKLIQVVGRMNLFPGGCVTEVSSFPVYGMEATLGSSQPSAVP